eukprot:CAMPEP_0117599212 /NCGR_PEP_ID=MMETSP0784-20121206/75823_1 /TAXON_ID=39447 /ORGANISM="" /LENGTH=135 /DNA_ID=CAMNT_0005401741 /DNA_START=117 /DNA_END=520 /DNA_ORIENTATION=-
MTRRHERALEAGLEAPDHGEWRRQARGIRCGVNGRETRVAVAVMDAQAHRVVHDTLVAEESRVPLQAVQQSHLVTAVRYPDDLVREIEILQHGPLAWIHPAVLGRTFEVVDHMWLVGPREDVGHDHDLEVVISDP